MLCTGERQPRRAVHQQEEPVSSSALLAAAAPPMGPDPALVVVARLVELADTAERLGLQDRARRARRLAGLLLGGHDPRQHPVEHDARGD